MAFYTIVSFCGGGVRGLLSAKILETLAAQYPQILTGTSLLAGTSTGSFIVSALVADPAVTPSALVDLYRYGEAPFFGFQNVDPSLPAYSNSKLINTVTGWHQGNTLSSLSQQVLFTAFELDHWNPILFNNVPQVVTKIPLFDNAENAIVDAVVASGAMPGMLPTYGSYVDGAFVHHDPTIAAIALALNAGVDIADIAAISIGTGYMNNYINAYNSTWGASQWLNGDPSASYDLPSLLVNENSTCPMLNLSLNGTSTYLMQQLAQMMLGERYVSLNPVLPQYIPENASSQEDLDALLAAAESLDYTSAENLLAAYWPLE